ncbi:MAG: Arc family DNA binding domain-containing protein [Acidobacteriia bacterium]|nr:Arc family DNA binding domain-containing protein [Terriglobia bacterium]
MAERKKLLLRISPSLWEELNRWAAREFRSVNGQIEFLLQRAVDERLGSPAKRKKEGDAEGL